MSILAGFIMPHPPLIVPQVGRGKQHEIQKTTESCIAAAKEIAAIKPVTVVIISPHLVTYSDYIHISPGKTAEGSLAQFGAPEEFSVDYDSELTGALSEICEQNGFPAGTLGEKDKRLDHGTLVPLYFIKQYCENFKLMRVSISGLSRREHYGFGMLLSRAAQKLGRKTVIVASGDLSHKLKTDGPYGFHADGPKLDEQLVRIMKSGDFGEFFTLDKTMCENAAECGLRGFLTMAGSLDEKAVEPRFYSYEGPFGVGYGVASFTVTKDAPERDFLAQVSDAEAQDIKRIRSGEGVYVRLARVTLEEFVRTGEMPAEPSGLPDEILTKRAGVFVSIKKHGELRGCIGTTSPAHVNIAREIMCNAIESGTGDPRFPPVRKNELDNLVYSVDVLSEAEPVPDRSMLDVKRYGVIVSKGMRRGLLLPNLDGVDTVEEQLSIACQKAGISPDESYEIKRFEVVRHT